MSQYFASFDHELENQGCISLFIEAYAANRWFVRQHDLGVFAL